MRTVHNKISTLMPKLGISVALMILLVYVITKDSVIFGVLLVTEIAISLMFMATDIVIVRLLKDSTRS